MKKPPEQHKHFWLIFFWSLGFTIQEKYDWYKDWVDVKDWTPDFEDPHCELRLKPDSQFEGVEIGEIQNLVNAWIHKQPRC